MLSLGWVFFLSFQTYGLITKPSAETIHGKSLHHGPTRQELALITSVPRIDSPAIQKRAHTATCAYISGNAALPLTCPSGTTCTAAGYIDGRRSWTCCDELQCLGDYSNCVDYGEKDLCLGLSEDSCSLLHTSVLSCSSASPSCMSYARSSGLGDFRTQYCLACGKSSGVVPARYSPKRGNTTGNDVQASPTSEGPSQGTDSSSSVGIQLSTKSTTGIVFGVLGILVHIFIAWRKRRQLLWCFTGGRHGQKPTIKKTPGGSSSVPDENQLSSLPPHSGPGYPPADVSQQSAIINGPNQQISNSGR